MKTIKFILRLILDTYREWSQDRAARLGAALAYYALFSITPLLVIMIAIAGAVYGEAAARGQIFDWISGQISPEAAHGVEQLLAGVHSSGSSLSLTAILSVIILIFGASNLFISLRDALNTLWNIRPRTRKNFFSGILDFARDRLISILMVIFFSLILLVVLALSTGLTALNGWLKIILPSITYVLLEISYLLTILGVTSIIFAITFKFLPDAKISWRVVWVSALLTSLLFNAGVLLIGLYLGYTGTQSALGAAGSIIVIMIWVYYSAQIFFFGAKFALVYASAISKPILSASQWRIAKSKPSDIESPDANQ